MGDSVSGVTFECDYPPEASRKPIIVNTLVRSGLSPQEIDQAVRTQIADGGNLYFVDLPKLEAIQPDIVITQDLCRVCAIETVGNAIGRDSEARILVNELRSRVENVESTVGCGKSPRVLCLEWLSPLFQGGHWIPEMVAIAGGDAVLSTPGEKSISIS